MFGIVILHYKSIDDTIECICSIREKYPNDEYHVVVVDNGSPDKSGRCLKELYKFDIDVDVIISDQNLGFACGNNLGYQYLKSKYAPEFIIIVNNDVVFIQNEFMHIIEQIYSKEKFDVLGPDILDSTKKIHTSPLRKPLLSYTDLKKEVQKETFIYFMLRNATRKKIYNYLLSVKHKIFGIHGSHETNDRYKDNKKQYRCVLQGSCVIFSPQYIFNHNNAFYPETFLYYEEYFLTYLLNNVSGLIIYSPELKIVHKGAVSTKLMYNEANRELWSFRMKQSLRSRKILLKLMKTKRDIDW